MLETAASTSPTWVQALDIVAWPLTVLGILLLLVSENGRKLVRDVLRRVTKFKGPGGWSLELTVEAAKETHADVERAIDSYRPALDAELGRLAESHYVFDRMVTTVNEALGPKERGRDNLRATVYVRDVLLKNTLYQLVDYYPTPTGRVGRRFSQQFGMIGRAWRRGRSLYQPDVPVDKAKLIDEWGMTEARASTAGRGQQSFVCIVLEHGGVKVGLLYLDAKVKGAFGFGVRRRLESHASRLAEAVGEVHAAVAGKGAKLALHDDD
jgi:hypothetical protein